MRTAMLGAWLQLLTWSNGCSLFRRVNIFASHSPHHHRPFTTVCTAKKADAVLSFGALYEPNVVSMAVEKWPMAKALNMQRGLKFSIPIRASGSSISGNVACFINLIFSNTDHQLQIITFFSNDFRQKHPTCTLLSMFHFNVLMQYKTRLRKAVKQCVLHLNDRQNNSCSNRASLLHEFWHEGQGCLYRDLFLLFSLRVTFCIFSFQTHGNLKETMRYASRSKL